MGIFGGLFRSRDKPKDSTAGSAYRFFMGNSASGKRVNERSAMQITAMIQSTGLPFAYDHFAEGESPKPPFICFLCPSADNFAADGIVYFSSDVLHIELYTDRKGPEAEALVEAVLTEHEIFYNKSEVWIASERLYEVLYEMEV